MLVCAACGMLYVEHIDVYEEDKDVPVTVVEVEEVLDEAGVAELDVGEPP